MHAEALAVAPKVFQALGHNAGEQGRIAPAGVKVGVEDSDLVCTWP